MKKLIFLFTLTSFFYSCENSTKSTNTQNEVIDNDSLVIDYPDEIMEVFQAHGGLAKWNEMRTLEFTIQNEEGDERVLTSLKTRKSLIETEKFRIGFDGDSVWIEQDSAYFKNDPKFYHNLMFYFYAMPFVLADPGINYSSVDSLEFQGNSYPGIKISYNDGIGDSPEDEYVLYYNPETKKMEWLSYTVTYFSGDKSQDFHYIKYDQWQDINGLLLPKTLQWYNVEGDSITSMSNERVFKAVRLSQEELPDSTFEKMGPSN
ncbi:MAG: DUF6503 family protein [Flavobacteriaceae bacterium]|nr:DUF6503 family protein [Flavobacteriaceae bacterium]